MAATNSYLFIRKFAPFKFRARLKSLSIRSKIYVFLGSFFGTYLSLALYLQAITNDNHKYAIKIIKNKNELIV